MRIGLISDTHVPSMGDAPPPEVEQAFEGVDLILHAGDIYTQSCLDWLGRIAPVESASSRFAALAEGAPRTGTPIVVQAGGHSIGVVHKLELLPIVDEIFPGALATYPEDESLADELVDIFGEPVDIVVFGYTHLSLVETLRGVLFVNPGSTTMKGQVMQPGTVALLDLDGEPKAEIIELADLGG